MCHVCCFLEARHWGLKEAHICDRLVRFWREARIPLGARSPNESVDLDALTKLECASSPSQVCHPPFDPEEGRDFQQISRELFRERPPNNW